MMVRLQARVLFGTCSAMGVDVCPQRLLVLCARPTLRLSVTSLCKCWTIWTTSASFSAVPAVDIGQCVPLSTSAKMPTQAKPRGTKTNRVES
eukprot:564522-Amphidinium_carterae.1